MDPKLFTAIKGLGVAALAYAVSQIGLVQEFVSSTGAFGTAIAGTLGVLLSDILNFLKGRID